jgi:hypothetical protein
MNLPEKTESPFFAYGLFKPGELCYFRIRELVDKKRVTKAKVNGRLKERDGIPLLDEGDLKIEGYLIYFKNGKEIEAYERIIDIEPDKVYYWDHIIDLENNMSANVLRGKKLTSGCSELEHWTSWTGRTDPFFKVALDEVELIYKEVSSKKHDDDSDFFRSLFRLQMGYMLLWSSIERYAGLRYHLKKDVTKKVKQIAIKETKFADSLKRHVKRKDTITGAADLKPYNLDPNNPKDSIDYYYQVRSNVVHRGKARDKDFYILMSALKELLPIFRELLEESLKMD